VVHDVPEEVRKLIADHIVSVEQLEILLLLRAKPDVEWTAKAVSEEIRTSEGSAAMRLDDLRNRGFLTMEDRDAKRYVFAPTDATLRRSVDSLANTYAERRYTVIDLIFQKPIDNLRVYADAFRLRWKEEDSDG
jgi:hypothetical protein